MIAELLTAIVLSVTDGDTFTAVVHDWHPPFQVWTFRTRDLDTPELRGKCEAERALARQAKTALERLLPIGSTVTLRRIDFDKYGGRLDADVLNAEKVDVAADLQRRGLGRRYSGKGKRKGWCE